MIFVFIAAKRLRCFFLSFPSFLLNLVFIVAKRLRSKIKQQLNPFDKILFILLFKKQYDHKNWSRRCAFSHRSRRRTSRVLGRQPGRTSPHLSPFEARCPGLVPFVASTTTHSCGPHSTPTAAPRPTKPTERSPWEHACDCVMMFLSTGSGGRRELLPRR